MPDDESRFEPQIEILPPPRRAAARREHGGTLDKDLVPKMWASVPAGVLVTWKERPKPFVEGRVHDKVAVIGSARAFITSANLADHAMEKSMEAGLLINRGPVPKTLSDHPQALIDLRVLHRA